MQLPFYIKKQIDKEATPIHREATTTIYGDCMEINKDNDCPHYNGKPITRDRQLGVGK